MNHGRAGSVQVIRPPASRPSPGSHAPPQRVRAVLGPWMCAQGVAVDEAVLRRPAGRDERRRPSAPLQPRRQRIVEGPQLGVLLVVGRQVNSSVGKQGGGSEYRK